MIESDTKDKSLESWIWDAACSIRGARDAPKFKDYILPLIFTKRLCDVFDDEVNRIAAEVGSRKKAFHLTSFHKRRCWSWLTNTSLRPCTAPAVSGTGTAVSRRRGGCAAGRERAAGKVKCPASDSSRRAFKQPAICAWSCVLKNP